jgi:hypothetical protein
VLAIHQTSSLCWCVSTCLISSLGCLTNTALGERLNDDSIKQAAWDILADNSTGAFGDTFLNVGGTDVLNPIREVCSFPFGTLHELKFVRVD